MNIFSIKRFSKSPKEMADQLNKIIDNHFDIDINNFPIPLSFIEIDKDYYKNAITDLEFFTKAIDKIFLTIIKRKDFSGLNLQKEEIDILKAYDVSVYSGTFLRLDCALTKEGPKVFEINARHPFGPGSFFLFHQLIHENVAKNKYIHFQLERTLFNVFKPLAQKNETLYLTYQPGKISAIEIQELQFLTELFQGWGLNSILLPLTNLKYNDNKFYFGEKKIDIIYRWFELQNTPAAFLAQLQKSIQIKELKILNDFSSLILGNKNFLALLSEGKFDDDLSEKEKILCKKIIPQTMHLDNDKLDFLQKNKSNYLLKESRGTEGKNIFFGADNSDEEWKIILNRLLDQDYISQEVINLLQANLNYYLNGKILDQGFNFDFDPYFINNKICGYISRASSNKITNYNAGGMLAAVLIEK